MIEKKKKEEEENAREARLKRWLQIFEKQTNRKWHERKNSLENKLTQARKYKGMVIAKKKKKKKKKEKEKKRGIEWC